MWIQQLLPGLPSGLRFLAVPLIEGLRSGVIPALRLVFSSETFQIVHHTDKGRKFRPLGRRQEDFYLDDWLKQFDCEEAGFLCSDLLGFGGRR